MLEDKLRRLSAEDTAGLNGPARTEEFIGKLNMGFLVELIDFSRTYQESAFAILSEILPVSIRLKLMPFA